MPNAKTANVPSGKSILALGETGSGKTTQFLSLPGSKFAYIFDPNALSSLQWYDVDYEEYLPDKLSLKLTSLSAGKGDDKKDSRIKSRGAEVYRLWEEHFERMIATGGFDRYENIMLDSGTTFLDMIMDGVLAINGRGGQWPQQDDYGPQIMAFHNIMRTLTSLDKRVYVTGHVETIKDEITSKVFNVPMMTGRLKKKIPLLFSEVLFFDAHQDSKGKTNYRVQTKPNRDNPTIRCSIKGLEAFEDITIDFNKQPEGQGLGEIIRKAQRSGPRQGVASSDARPSMGQEKPSQSAVTRPTPL